MLCIEVREMASMTERSLLGDLRKRTGISFINCRKALEQFENDIDKAEKWLTQQAQREGWQKAAKLQTRHMVNGLISVIGDANALTMIEVNCETDFVARNNKFISLVTQASQDCHNALLQQPGMSQLDEAAGSLLTSDGKTIADNVALTIGAVGENIRLRRAVHLKAGNSHLASYIHPSDSPISGSDCRVGKYGAIVSLSCSPTQESQYVGRDESNFPSYEVSAAIGQHIVGMSPRVIGDMDQALAIELESESDMESSDDDVSSESSSAESSDEKVIDEQHIEEEDRLLFQRFLLEPDKNVAQILHQNGIVVDLFHRFCCGESLPVSNGE